LEKKMTDTSGRKCLESFKRFPRNGSWAKTFSELLIGTEDWYSTRCRLTWKLKGTKYNRMYFQLQVSTHPTEEIGSGLLLTPSTVDIVPDEDRLQKRTEYRDSIGRKWCPGSLTEQVFHSLLLTPTASEAIQNLETFKKRMEKYPNGTTMPISIIDFAIYNGLIPTPTAQDGQKNASLPPSQIDRNDSIVKRILEVNPTAGKTSQLNPLFVEEMMGFPHGYTIAPFLNPNLTPTTNTKLPNDNWQHFPLNHPTIDKKNPIKDILSESISFSKWRNESIKGYGNAIVPQVALKLFQAIQAYNNTTATEA
jgi:hypothetical protein